MGCCQGSEKRPNRANDVAKNRPQPQPQPQSLKCQQQDSLRRTGQAGVVGSPTALGAGQALLSIERYNAADERIDPNTTIQRQQLEATDPRAALETNFPLFCQKYDIGKEIGTGLGSHVFLLDPKPGVDMTLCMHEAQPTTDAGPTPRIGEETEVLDVIDVKSQTPRSVSSAPPPPASSAPHTGQDTQLSNGGGISRPLMPPLPLPERPTHQLPSNSRFCCKITRASASDEDTKQHWKEVVAYRALAPDDHIVDVVDHFMNENWGVVVLRVMDGGHIKVGEQRWSEACVAAVARQILLLLDDMHATGYAHLDIKPRHILTEAAITDDTDPSDIHIRLCGFACCSRFKPGVSSLDAIPESPLYIAPEVWKIVMSVPSATLFDERCDIWALGVVVYLMLSARHPFIDRPLRDCNETDYKELFEAIYTDDDDPVKFPKEAFEGVSDEAKHFILELLQIDFRSRATAAQALAHPFVRKYAPDPSYLDHLKPSSIMFNFHPERTDINVDNIRELREKMKPSKPAESQVLPPVVSPPVSPGGAGPDTARSARRRKSWQEESMSLIRKDSGGQVIDVHFDNLSHSQNSHPQDGHQKVKSPKLFMGSPVKTANALSPHLKPHVLFPKERFSSSSDAITADADGDDEDGTASPLQLPQGQRRLNGSEDDPASPLTAGASPIPEVHSEGEEDTRSPTSAGVPSPQAASPGEPGSPATPEDLPKPPKSPVSPKSQQSPEEAPNSPQSSAPTIEL